MIDLHYFLSYVKDAEELDEKCEKNTHICWDVIERYLVKNYGRKYVTYDHMQLLEALISDAFEVSVNTIRNKHVSISIQNLDSSVVEFEIEPSSPESASMFLPLAIKHSTACDVLKICSHLKLRFERYSARWHITRVYAPVSDVSLWHFEGRVYVSQDAEDACLNAMIAGVYNTYFVPLLCTVKNSLSDGEEAVDMLTRLDAWVQDTMRSDELEKQLIQDTVCSVKEQAENKDAIQSVCAKIADMLHEKQRKYGNAALEPIRVFSKADRLEQLKVRIDDKLSRLRNMQKDDDEDVVKDLTGYLVLYMVARSSNNEVSNRGESVDNER